MTTPMHLQRSMLTAACTLLLCNAAPARATCLSDARVAEQVAAYQAGTTAATPPALSVDDAECSRANFNSALQPGDPVSLGSFSRLLPPASGLAVEVEYLGLPGNPRVDVNFE